MTRPHTVRNGLGSVAENLMYNENLTIEEIAKSAAASAAWGIIGNDKWERTFFVDFFEGVDLKVDKISPSPIVHPSHMQIFAQQSVTFKVHSDGYRNTKTIDDTQYDMYLGNDGEYYPTESKGKYNSDRYKNTEQSSINYLKHFKTAISK